MEYSPNLSLAFNHFRVRLLNLKLINKSSIICKLPCVFPSFDHMKFSKTLCICSFMAICGELQHILLCNMQSLAHYRCCQETWRPLWTKQVPALAWKWLSRFCSFILLKYFRFLQIPAMFCDFSLRVLSTFDIWKWI